MQIRNLMAKLAESGIACSYRGDEDVAFQRLILYPKTVVEGDFIAVVDKSWDPSTRKQFKDRDIKVQIKEALKAGVTGFICGSDVAEHPLLKNANVISADSSLGLSVAIAKVFRDVPERAMLTAVTGSAGKSTTKAMLAHALEAMDESTRIFSPPSPRTSSVQSSRTWSGCTVTTTPWLKWLRPVSSCLPVTISPSQLTSRSSRQSLKRTWTIWDPWRISR